MRLEDVRYLQGLEARLDAYPIRHRRCPGCREVPLQSRSLRVADQSFLLCRLLGQCGADNGSDKEDRQDSSTIRTSRQKDEQITYLPKLVCLIVQGICLAHNL